MPSRTGLDVGGVTIVDGYMKIDYLASCAGTLERSYCLSKAKIEKQEEQDGQRSQTNLETGLGIVVEDVPYQPGSVCGDLAYSVLGGHITHRLFCALSVKIPAMIFFILG